MIGSNSDPGRPHNGSGAGLGWDPLTFTSIRWQTPIGLTSRPSNTLIISRQRKGQEILPSTRTARGLDDERKNERARPSDSVSAYHFCTKGRKEHVKKRPRRWAGGARGEGTGEKRRPGADLPRQDQGRVCMTPPKSARWRGRFRRNGIPGVSSSMSTTHPCWTIPLRTLSSSAPIEGTRNEK